MDKKWSLKELYTSFEDIQFQNDLKEVETILNDMRKYPLLPNEQSHLIQYLEEENHLDDLVEKLYAYVSLTMNADTNDYEAIKYASVIETLLASFADASAKIQKWIAQFDFQQLTDSYVQDHMFVLNEIKQQNKYLLDDQSESVLANMKTTGSSSWLKYKDQLISSLEVIMDGKVYPLTEVLNMAYSKDKEIRKKAYEAEIAAYTSVEHGIASALNAIKGEAITVTQLRG